jgi:putative flippase GtrA
VKLHTLVYRYVVFAILATLVNLIVQRLVLWFGDGSAMFALALAAGTAMGLLVKYFLDKHWIFEDLSVGAIELTKKFSLYTVMGIFTTLIFWGTEILFWLTWRTDMMREVGAIVGLSIGYFVKYHLDRRYVFTDSKLARLS